MERTRRVRMSIGSVALGLALALVLPAGWSTLEAGQTSTDSATQDAKKNERKRRNNQKKNAGERKPRATAASTETGSGGAAESLSPAVTRALDQIDRRLAAWNTAEARRLVQELTDAPASEVAIARGRVAQQELDWSTARTELQKAVEADPDSPVPLVYLGETHLFAENQSAASQAFTSAAQVAQARLARDANDLEALYSLGVAQQRLKRYDEAYTTLGKARQAAPDDAMIVYQMGVTRAFQERWTDAVSLLDQAIEMNSGIAYAYYYRGLAEGRAGRKDLLVNDLNRFLAMAPHAPDAAKARKILESV